MEVYEKQRVRVQFANDGAPDEYLWAEPMSRLRCRVLSVPIMTAGVAPGDEVAVSLLPDGGRRYAFTVAMAPTRVYLVYSLPAHTFSGEEVERVEGLARLNDGKGAVVSTASASAIALAVPSASAEALAESLELGERNGLWRMVESTYGQPR